jgi:hypothetical protein
MPTNTKDELMSDAVGCGLAGRQISNLRRPAFFNRVMALF